MNFLTDFLRQLKLKQSPLASVKEAEQTESSEIPKNSEEREGLSAQLKGLREWKKSKVLRGVCAAVGVVALGLALWRFWPSKPIMAAQPQVPGVKEPLPLSNVERDLFQAIRNDDADSLRRCLDAGANVNATDITGVTPIKAAIALNRKDAVRALLDGGYDDSKEGSSSLVYAIVQNRPEITRELLKSAVEKGTAGKVVNQIDKNGYTPLMYAIDRNHVAVAQELLNAGADVNELDKEGYTPLMMAVTVGKADMVAALLKAGANRNAVSPGGETAMSMARRRNRQVVVSILLEAERSEASLSLRREETLSRREAL
jgi:hypothetical protein